VTVRPGGGEIRNLWDINSFWATLLKEMRGGKEKSTGIVPGAPKGKPALKREAKNAITGKKRKGNLLAMASSGKILPEKGDRETKVRNSYNRMGVHKHGQETRKRKTQSKPQKGERKEALHVIIGGRSIRRASTPSRISQSYKAGLTAHD